MLDVMIATVLRVGVGGLLWMLIWMLLAIIPVMRLIPLRHVRDAPPALRRRLVVPLVLWLSGTIAAVAGIAILWLATPEDPGAIALTASQWVGSALGALLMLAGVVAVLVAPLTNFIRALASD